MIVAFHDKDFSRVVKDVSPEMARKGVKDVTFDELQKLDIGSFREEVGRMVQKYRRLSLKELQLGPILQEITEIGLRHHVPVPASLMLSGKAFAQMQLVAADLDPTLDPFAVAGSFVMRHTLGRLTAAVH